MGSVSIDQIWEALAQAGRIRRGRERKGGEDIGEGRESVTALLVRLLGEPFDISDIGTLGIRGGSKGSVGGDEEECGMG